MSSSRKGRKKRQRKKKKARRARRADKGMVHVVFNLTTSGKQVYMPVPSDLAQAIPLAQGNTIKLTDDELWLEKNDAIAILLITIAEIRDNCKTGKCTMSDSDREWLEKQLLESAWYLSNNKLDGHTIAIVNSDVYPVEYDYIKNTGVNTVLLMHPVMFDIITDNAPASASTVKVGNIN